MYVLDVKGHKMQNFNCDRYKNVQINDYNMSFDIENLEVVLSGNTVVYDLIQIYVDFEYYDEDEDEYEDEYEEILYITAKTKHKHLFISDLDKFCVGDHEELLINLFQNNQYLTVAMTLEEILKTEGYGGYRYSGEVLADFGVACSVCLRENNINLRICENTSRAVCNNCSYECRDTGKLLSADLLHKCSICERFSSVAKKHKNQVLCRRCYGSIS